MRTRTYALFPLLAALLLASCAGPAKLARQSDEALARGDLRKAYDRALRAVEKDPQNAAARASYTAASRRVADDYKARVRALAAADSVAAAGLALEYRAFRGSVAVHGSELLPDEAYRSAEARILGAAARAHYRQGREAMAAKRPKQAWREFDACRRYDGWADADKLQDRAYLAARSRVAVFPLEDGVRVPGLSQEVSERVDRELARRAAGSFRFTELVDPENVGRIMTVSQSKGMSRDEAMSLGRRLGADRVVVGRIAGLRSNNDLKDLTLPIYRRVESKDDKGVTRVRWDEATLRVVTREREVAVSWSFDVLDVESGAVVASRSVPSNTAARVVWTDFKPEGDCDRYALLPPDVRRSDAARARQVDAQWEERLGSWTLPSLLLKARDARGRARWSKEYRSDFRGVDSRRRPVWLGELPGEDDLAFVALDEAWHPVLTTLQELDARD